MTEILGAILAGGASTRMGTDKAAVQIAGRPMSAWVSAAFEAVIGSPGRIVVLGGAPIDGLVHVPDRPGTGPLRGVAAIADACALIGSIPDAALVVAVDHPWVRPRTLEALTESYDGRVVVPVDGNVRQVTCALYPMSFVTAAANAAAAARGFQEMLDRLDVDEVAPPAWQTWGEDGRSWFSVDTRDALVRGIREFGPPGEGTSEPES